ncbi:MAG TPA: NIPSNAP family protein [Candidatus Sulfotelmatobacter sp.]|nr:NIPSNAP family protein [Candidatus Sulfotelmatobacter sp.]
MIIEMRTYQLKPRSLPELLKRWAEVLPERVKLSPLGGFFYTEIGGLNQIIHMWPYENLGERDRIRAEAVRSKVWPPKIAEFIETMESKILVPAAFSPPMEPRQLGNVYEIRTYLFKPGTIPGVIERWSAAVPARIKLSPLVGAYHTEIGPLNQWIHIWAYKDAGERQRIRDEAVKSGVWPPPAGTGDALLKQENILVTPAPFSPLH